MTQTLNTIATQAERGEQLRISFRSHVATDSIQERFEVFHAANPTHLDIFVGILREKLVAGHKSYGMKAVFEEARIRHDITRDGRMFKLDNSFTAPYGRLVMELYPELRGFIRIKKRVSECQ